MARRPNPLQITIFDLPGITTPATSTRKARLPKAEAKSIPKQRDPDYVDVDWSEFLRWNELFIATTDDCWRGELTVIAASDPYELNHAVIENLIDAELSPADARELLAILGWKEGDEKDCWRVIRAVEADSLVPAGFRPLDAV
jgi:hypothetical protein